MNKKTIMYMKKITYEEYYSTILNNVLFQSAISQLNKLIIYKINKLLRIHIYLL